MFLFQFDPFLKYKFLCKIYHDSFTTICIYFLFIHWISFFDHHNFFVIVFDLLIQYLFKIIIIYKETIINILHFFTWWYIRK